MAELSDAISKPTAEEVPAGCMPAWHVDELPQAPAITWNPRALIGPGLLMVGAAIGGGEWLMGPAATAKYGGIIMGLATLSILCQVVYNLEVQRYTLYCGEPIFVGFFRLIPGPRFWMCLYLLVDFFGVWPYLAANAAIPLHAAIIGHMPQSVPTLYMSVDEVVARTGLPKDVVQELADHPKRFGSLQDVQTNTGLPEDVLRRWAQYPERTPDEVSRRLSTSSSGELLKDKPWKPYPAAIAQWMADEGKRTHWIAYGIYLLALVPLVFGGKVYNSIEKIMTAKVVLVLGYLLFLGIFFVSWQTWAEVFSGFIFFGKGADGSWAFRLLPDVPARDLDWALLGAFAAIAGVGGLNNSQLSTYVRDKGWGMGAKVGAIPSMIGGRGISLSHTGKVFRLTAENLGRWKGWLRFIRRDQLVIWAIGCFLGMAIPSLLSLEYLRGQQVPGNEVPAKTAQALTESTGIAAFWFLTLMCGFLVLGPTQMVQSDGLLRRWTDVLWTGNPKLKHLEGHQVKYVYYSLLVVYVVWGLIVMSWLGEYQLLMVKLNSVPLNFALGFSAWHTLAVNLIFLPKELRPGWFMRLGLVACGAFFIGIAILAIPGALSELRTRGLM
jgi:hypothetical protein